MIKEYKENRRKRILSALSLGFGLSVALMTISLMLFGTLDARGLFLIGFSWPLYCILIIKNSIAVQLFPEELLILCRGKVRHRLSLAQPIETAQAGRERRMTQYIVAGKKSVPLHYFSPHDFQLMIDEIHQHQRIMCQDNPELARKLGF